MTRTVGHFRTRYLQLTETFIYNYLTNHDRYESYVSSLFEENLDKFPYEPRYTLPNISENSLWYRGSRWIPEQPFGHPFYGKVIREHPPDVIHAHFGPTGATLSAYRSEKRPLVTSFYGYDASKVIRKGGTAKHRLKRRYYETIYGSLFRRGDLFLVEGPAMREKLIHLGCPARKIEVQRIAIDTSRIEPCYPSGTGTITVLMAGRFVEKKGMPDGISAFAEAFNDFDAELRIVGGGATEGYSREDLSELAARLGVDDQVKFTGYLSYEEYLEEIQTCDLLLAPSKTGSNGDSEGGAPTVLLEAQASGKPIVSTTHADIPYVVAHNETGLLVPPGDVNGLANALCKLRDEPNLFGTFGKKGRENMIKRHDVSGLVDELEEKYDKLCQRSP